LEALMYVSPNFQTKKALREALAADRYIEVYPPGLGSVPKNGSVYLEGPHYPQPHKWYAIGQMENGKLKSVK
jgi:hypothetical protein